MGAQKAGKAMERGYIDVVAPFSRSGDPQRSVERVRRARFLRAALEMPLLLVSGLQRLLKTADVVSVFENREEYGGRVAVRGNICLAQRLRESLQMVCRIPCGFRAKRISALDLGLHRCGKDRNHLWIFHG